MITSQTILCFLTFPYLSFFFLIFYFQRLEVFGRVYYTLI